MAIQVHFILYLNVLSIKVFARDQKNFLVTRYKSL